MGGREGLGWEDGRELFEEKKTWRETERDSERLGEREKDSESGILGGEGEREREREREREMEGHRDKMKQPVRYG